MAAAHAAITAIEDEDVVARALALGERLLAALRGMAGGPPIVEIRGRGLLIGIECESGHVACDLMLELLEHGVIVNHSLNDHSVIRLTPPAVMSEADVAWLLQAMHDSLAAVTLRHTPVIAEAV
jgi:putrescine aminotransferase